MRRSSSVLCAVVVAASSLSAAAHADDEDVIKYRQHIMTALHEQTAALGLILSGQVPEDNFAGHLDAIALTASTALKAFEPRVPGGESRPEVWSDWRDFAARMNSFAQKTAQAAKDANAGKKDEVVAALIDALSCKGCHDVYRDETKK